MKLAARSLDGVFAQVRDELMLEDMERFEAELAEALEPQRGYLSDVELNLYRQGKKLRPLMLLLTARMSQPEGPLPRKVLRAAASLEMLHVATLIHDDIVDHALLRRGLDSVNAARGTEMAVLIGDMQFVQAVRCFVDAIEDEEDMALVKLVLDTAFDICRGEVDEMVTEASWAIDVLLERYLSTIDRKTGVLFGLACESGAALMKARRRDVRRMGFFGREVGRAFQMMDDLFDLAHAEQQAGKTRGIDLRRRRLTLPILFAMQDRGADSSFTAYIRGAHASEDQLDRWVEEVRRAPSFVRAYQQARSTALEAVHLLSFFPDGPHLQALRSLTHAVVDRPY